MPNFSTRTSITILLVLVSCASTSTQVDQEQSLIFEATISQVQSAILNFEVTCEDIVRAHVRRIATYDQKMSLNAITRVNRYAVDQARAVDRKIMRGNSLGSLFCVPVLIKDNIDVAGLETTGGSVALKGLVVNKDATIVRRLLDADAVILAKTNMAEWAISQSQTLSSTHGATANAYELDRVPGGSSGGTASGVAASFGIVGIGTDTGSSVRGPASHLALFGLRPTLGLVSRAGILPLAADRDTAGPMARTVGDGARLLSVIAGRDRDDDYTDAIPAGMDLDFAKHLRKDGLSGKRIGVVLALTESEDADPQILHLFETALEDMEKRGAIIVSPVNIRNFQHHTSGNGYFCPRFNFDVNRYLSARDRPVDIDMDELLSTQAHAADPVLVDVLSMFSNFPSDVKPDRWTVPCAEFNQHEGRLALRKDVLHSMDAANVDVLAFPTWLKPPATMSKANEDYGGDNNFWFVPGAGLPAATVPMGWGSSGLPAGMQLVGRPFADAVVIEIAYAYEAATTHRRPPTNFPVVLSPIEGSL